MSWERTGPRTITDSDVYVVDSDNVGDRLQVTVARPAFADAMPGPYPTLYVLDPIATLDVTIGLTRALGTLAFGAFPPVLVVGIGYPTPDPLRTMSLRFRDLTPTDAPPPAALAPPVPPADGLGGADRFLAALADEVMPFVESTHSGDPGDRTIVGWSLGGLFGLHALFTRPGLFRRHLLASPSIWWDESYGLRAEEQYAAQHDDLAAQLYIGVGEAEETAAARQWPVALPPEGVAAGSMVTNVRTLTRRLRSRGYRGLDVEAEVLPGEHHVTIFPTVLSRGLVHLFTG